MATDFWGRLWLLAMAYPGLALIAMLILCCLGTLVGLALVYVDNRRSRCSSREDDDEQHRAISDARATAVNTSALMAPGSNLAEFKGTLIADGQARILPVDEAGRMVPVLVLDVRAESMASNHIRVEQPFPPGADAGCRAAARRYREGMQIQFSGTSGLADPARAPCGAHPHRSTHHRGNHCMTANANRAAEDAYQPQAGDIAWRV